MTASEFSFLALGLILGVVVGAALVELVRARPPSPREVRLTVSHDVVPRRSSTLADDAFTAGSSQPARGGPADRRLVGLTMPSGASERRTSVRYRSGGASFVPYQVAGAIPIVPDRLAPIPGPIMESALPLSTPRPGSDDQHGPTGRMVGIAISGGDDPAMLAFRSQAIALAGGAALPASPASSVSMADSAVAQLERPEGGRRAPKSADTEGCTEERRLADERCELATLARARSEVALDALRAAQRTYDGHEAAAVTATWRADPRAVHEAKDAAQGGFRTAVSSATSPEQLETAARDWLSEINRINTEARDATVTASREHAAAMEVGSTLERLGLEADAARIGAENADAVCLAARAAVADCVEQASTGAAFLIPPAPETPDTARLADDERLGLALEAGGEPRIFRLLRGDRQAMTTLVASLAGDDPDARRRWQLQLAGLVEAIVADAIEASALQFPEGHPFWSEFTRVQGRDIVEALSSLGYRFDGLGGWTDARHPSQRDLSLAMGYAGLDPKRIRHWPTEESISALFADVMVTADEYLTSVAGDLTLAEMVTMLGRRADGLAEIWNQWGRIRPLLLDES
ncbi:MAG: hypothetical protein ABI553_02250 [Chloroflexota bacterium]